jgi:predicted polyphosphate/ATP-dependent NAD kinase
VKKLGFLVNPIAGMGGAVGLKGTDGEEVLKEAICLGAKPIAPLRAETFLLGLKAAKTRLRLFVGAGMMGEDEARKFEFDIVVFGERKEETTAEDTKKISMRMRDEGVDLLIFCGGDGTARNVFNSVNKDIPVLGVPTGVKMHSAVFALDPKAAARIVIKFLKNELPLREAEVMDVDEEAFRDGRLSARLYGYVLTPYEPTMIQRAKIASPITETEMHNQAAIALYVIENMEPEVIYIIGPGTTTRTIADLLDEKKTLLGVDIFLNKKLVGRDVNETRILERIKRKPAKIVVTPIGGQGFIFGRGNLQISPSIIRRVGRDNIIVISTKQKLRVLKTLKVDTGDNILDNTLRGYIKVITDYNQENLIRIE